MRNLEFGTGEYYHVYNRGVDKRQTFIRPKDYQLFLSVIGRSKHDLRTGKHLVNVHAFACMPNHFHFLLEQVCDDGISQFMQRLSTSYTRSFNHHYERTGSLFETTYKAKHINNDSYLATIATYIHRNPIGLPGIKNLENLAYYPWSSFSHYSQSSQSLFLDDAMLFDFFGGPSGVKAFHEKDVSCLVDTFEEDEPTNYVRAKLSLALT